MKGLRLLLAVACLVAWSIPAIAQEASVPYTESIEVRVTSIEVVVTDAKGRWIEGLKKEDFELSEDGRVQALTNFFEAKQLASPEPSRSQEAVEGVEAPPLRRHVILFVDDDSVTPFRRKLVLAALERFIRESLLPGDRIMVVSWHRGLHLQLPFSDDHEKAFEAVARLSESSGGDFFVQRQIVEQRIEGELSSAIFASSRENLFPQAFAQSMTHVNHFVEEQRKQQELLSIALQRMIATLAGVEGRKALVLVGQNLPGYLGRELYQFIFETFQPYSNRVPNLDQALRAGMQNSQYSVHEEIARTANANGVALYLVHSGGIDPDATSGAQSARGHSETYQFLEFTNSATSFVELAKQTGGAALVGTNDFSAVFDLVARDLGSYYSLGYRSDAPSRSDRRKLVIRLPRYPDLSVRYRQSVLVKSYRDEVRDATLANVFSTPSRNQIAITIRTGAPVRAGRGTRKVPVEIEIPAGQLVLLPDGDELAGGFTVSIGAGDPQGRFSNITTKTQSVRVPASKAGQEASAHFTFTSELLVRKDETIISVGVVDEVSKAVGFARTTVDEGR